LNIARLLLAITLGLLVMISLSPAVQADDDGTEVQLKVEILSSRFVPTATGTGNATFTADCGTITGLSAVAEGTLPAAGKPAGVNFPHGLFSCDITNITACPTVTLTIELPSAVPVGTTYWKCQGGTWVDCTSLLGDNDGDNILTLTLTDGGLGDSDGAADGTIVDPGGPAVAAAAPPVPSGGGGGGGAGAVTTTSATIAINVLGAITTATTSYSGELLAAVTATDGNNIATLEFDKGTTIVCAENIVPRRIELKLAGSPPPPANATVVGPIYELNAYIYEYGSNSCPVNISPTARLALSYDPENLPENASAIFIAYYDEAAGRWVQMETAGYVAGGVAVPNTLTSHVGHFTPFAILANLAEVAPAKFETTNLTISPAQARQNQEITISIYVTNSGGTTGEHNIELKVDGISKATRQITLAPETSQGVNFTITEETVGKHQVEVVGLVGEFEITEPPSGIIWWLIGGTLAIAVLLAVWLTWGRRWLRDHHPRSPKQAKAAS